MSHPVSCFSEDTVNVLHANTKLPKAYIYFVGTLFPSTTRGEADAKNQLKKNAKKLEKLQKSDLEHFNRFFIAATKEDWKLTKDKFDEIYAKSETPQDEGAVLEIDHIDIQALQHDKMELEAPPNLSERLAIVVRHECEDHQCSGLESAIMPMKLPLNTRSEQRTMIENTFKDQCKRIENCVTEIESLLDTKGVENSCRSDEMVHALRFQVAQMCTQLNYFNTNLLKLKQLFATESGTKRILRECQRVEAALPALSIREKLETTFASKSNMRACVVTGATGSGKTTQVSQYLAELEVTEAAQRASANVKMTIVTQPRKLAALSLADRVSQEWGDADAVSFDVGYSPETTLNKNTRILFVTEFAFIAFLTESKKKRNDLFCPSRIAAVMVDEAHERSVQCDILLALLLQKLKDSPEWSHVKLIVSSATIDVGLFAGYVSCINSPHPVPHIEIPGVSYPVKTHYTANDVDQTRAENVLDAAVEKCIEVAKNGAALRMQIHGINEADSKKNCDILCFIGGASEAETAATLMRQRLKDTTGVEVLELSGRSTADEQKSIVKNSARRPIDATDAEDSQVRVIFATAVAETSITIDSIGFVIDSGLVRRTQYDHKRGISRQQTLPITKQNANQRKGRCGRTSPGIVYRLYSEEQYETFDACSPCQLLVSPIENACLSLLRYGVRDVTQFSWIEPPPQEVIEASLARLERFDAIKKMSPAATAASTTDPSPATTYKLTEFGEFACRIEMEFKQSHFIFCAKQSADIDLATALIVSATWASASFLFVFGAEGKKKERDAIRKKQAQGALGSDLIAAATLFAKWDESTNQEARSVFATENFLGNRALREIKATFHLTASKLGRKFSIPDCATIQANAEKVKRLLIQSLHEQLAVRRFKSTYLLESGDIISLHGSSLLGKLDRNPDVVVFGDRFETSRPFIRCVTVVTNELPQYHEKIQEMKKRQISLFEVPVPTAIANSWRNYELTEMMFAELDKEARVYHHHENCIYRVKILSAHEETARERMRDFLDQEVKRMQQVAIEVPVCGSLRALFGPGFVIQDFLEGGDEQVTLRFKPSAELASKISSRKKFIEFLSTKELKLQSTSPQTITPSSSETPQNEQAVLTAARWSSGAGVGFIQFGSPEQTQKGLALLNDACPENGTVVKPTMRYEQYTAVQLKPVLNTYFRFKLNLAVEQLDDNDIQPTPEGSMGNKEIWRIARAFKDIFPPTIHTDIRHYPKSEHSTPCIIVDVHTNTSLTEQLNAIKQKLDIEEGFQKIRSFCDCRARFAIPRSVTSSQIKSCLSEGVRLNEGSRWGTRNITVSANLQNQKALQATVDKIWDLVSGKPLPNVTWNLETDASKIHIFETFLGKEFLEYQHLDTKEAAKEAAATTPSALDDEQFPELGTGSTKGEDKKEVLLLNRWRKQSYAPRNLTVDFQQCAVLCHDETIAARQGEEISRFVEAVSPCEVRRYVPADRKSVKIDKLQKALTKLEQKLLPLGVLAEPLQFRSGCVSVCTTKNCEEVYPDLEKDLEALKLKVADDIALDDERENSDADLCPVCYCEPIEPYRLVCGAMWCRDCLKQYVTHNVSLPLVCHHCNQLFATKDIDQFFSDILLKPFLKKLIDSAVNQYASANEEVPEKKVLRCPSTCCSGVRREIGLQGGNFECFGCNFQYCIKCSEVNKPVPYHFLGCPKMQSTDLLKQRILAAVHDEMVNKCPKCKAPFLEFDGCYAVTCDKCHAGFCGYCMQVCGADAHDHVMAKHRDEGGYFPAGGIQPFHEKRTEEHRAAVVLLLAAHFQHTLASLEKEERDDILASVVGESNKSCEFRPPMKADEIHACKPQEPPDSLKTQDHLSEKVDLQDEYLSEKIKLLVKLLLVCDQNRQFKLLKNPPPLDQAIVTSLGKALGIGHCPFQPFAKERIPPDHKHQTVDGAAAIDLYTSNNIYQDLNRSLRSETFGSLGEDEKQGLRVYMHHLLKGLSAIPPVGSVKVYRGVKFTTTFTHKTVDLYRPGKIISWRAISSCSRDPQVCDAFSGGVKFYVQLHRSGVSVKPYSQYAGEDEVILPPGIPLLVTQKRGGGRNWTIELEEWCD